MFGLILENYPIPIAFVCVCDITRLGPLSLLNSFFFTVTRFEVFRIHWVTFPWQIVLGLSRAYFSLEMELNRA